MKTIRNMPPEYLKTRMRYWRSAWKYTALLTICMLFLSIPADAGEADVIDVAIKKTAENTYFFKVTVRHADEGWDHYANKWDVVAPDGSVLGTRTLYHPHVDEQPFTRSLSDVKIQEPINEVTVRAHDSVHEYGGKTVTVAVPK